MHIPPYYKRRGTQYFFVGIIIGAIIAYVLFLYINGRLIERWIEQNVELRYEIGQLENYIDSLQEEKENMTKENKEKLTLQEINVVISNAEQLKLDRFVSIDIITHIKNELADLIGNSLESLIENKSLIFSTIEKPIKIDDFTYRPEITQFTIVPPNMDITVKLKMSH